MKDFDPRPAIQFAIFIMEFENLSDCTLDHDLEEIYERLCKIKSSADWCDFALWMDQQDDYDVDHWMETEHLDKYHLFIQQALRGDMRCVETLCAELKEIYLDPALFPLCIQKSPCIVNIQGVLFASYESKPTY
jgi:hypothetical protein